MENRVALTAKKAQARQLDPTPKVQMAGFRYASDSFSAKVLSLQKTIGNQAIQRMLNAGIIRAKLKVAKPDEIFGREADSVAGRIMQMPGPRTAAQRRGALEDVTALGSKAPELSPQTETPEIDDSEIRGRFEPTPSSLESDLLGMKGSGSPLPGSTRSFFETRFGRDFGHVRAHTRTQPAVLGGQIGAKAFAKESDNIFGRDRYSPQSPDGKKSLAHELMRPRQPNGPVSRLPEAGDTIQLDVDRNVFPWEGRVDNCRAVWFRRTASSRTDSNKIRALPAGTVVTVTGRTRGWLHVTHGTDNGYIYQNYVVVAPSAEFGEAIASGEQGTWVPSSATSTVSDFAVWARRANGTINTAGTNFRATPGGRIRRALARGTALTVIGRSGNWYRVTVGTDTGYVHRSLVDVTPFNLASSTRLNCWEMVLLMAFRSGSVDWDWIHNMYVRVPQSTWESHLTTSISTYDSASIASGTITHAYTGAVPRRGDIVFWEGLAHVGMATGSTGADGTPQVYTFWPPPGTPFTPGGTLDNVKTSTITILTDYILNNFSSISTVNVTFGTPSWYGL
jgi:hypothetical protein